MSRANRGGLTLKAGKIGQTNILRQQLLMPGERMNVNISGTVKLEALRERESMRINAHLATFIQPLRWLWPEFPDYMREGPNTAQTPPIIEFNRLSDYGIGSYDPGDDKVRMFRFWQDAVFRIYNEWYKWPEEPDWTPEVEGWPADGAKAVPLSKSWSRCRFERQGDDATQTTVNTTNDSFDVRTLATKQANFRAMMKRDVLSFQRWMEFIKETYNGDGSREVDQVPIMLDQTEVGVNPREIPATDGSSLGQWQSLYDFQVNHGINGIVAPEHSVLTYVLVIRFAPIIDGIHPLATDDADWFDLTADPEYITSASPRPVKVRQVAMDPANETELGYLPAGWQWRAENDVIGYRLDELDSFPYMLRPENQGQAKDATRIKNAFRSERLGDYVADLYFKEDSRQPIGTAMDSYFSGMLDDAIGQSQSNDEFPKGGKQL